MASPSTSINYVRPWVYPKQEAAIFHTKRYGLIEASTKSGKTQGCIIWLTEKALFGRSGQAFWWVAPSHNQAKIAYSRLKNALPPGMFSANDTDMTLRLPVGSTIWFKTGEVPDKLYGEDVWAVVIDEASRVRADAWYAIRSTMTATKGPVRAIGNVKGRKNWFYDLARRAEREMESHPATTDMHYAKLTALDAIEAGIFDEKELASAKTDLPEDLFRELYYAEASDDGGNPFGIEWIRKCLAPTSGRPVVHWGWDVAKKRDYTVGFGLDAEGYVSRVEGPWHAPWETTIRRIREATGDVPALVDSTGVGDAVLEFLQKGSSGNFRGYVFTSKSKQQLMEGLAVGIQREEIHFPPGFVQRELESFEYVESRTGVSYSAPPGLHDDGVCALALAWKGLRKPDRPEWAKRALAWKPPAFIPLFAR